MSSWSNKKAREYYHSHKDDIRARRMGGPRIERRGGLHRCDPERMDLELWCATCRKYTTMYFSGATVYDMMVCRTCKTRKSFSPSKIVPEIYAQ